MGSAGSDDDVVQHPGATELEIPIVHDRKQSVVCRCSRCVFREKHHPSGAVHVFADGSVTMIQGEVDLQAYHGFGTRNGGEAGATP